MSVFCDDCHPSGTSFSADFPPNLAFSGSSICDSCPAELNIQNELQVGILWRYKYDFYGLCFSKVTESRKTHCLNLVILIDLRRQLGKEITAVYHYAQIHQVSKKKESYLGFQGVISFHA